MEPRRARLFRLAQDQVPRHRENEAGHQQKDKEHRVALLYWLVF